MNKCLLSLLVAFSCASSLVVLVSAADGVEKCERMHFKDPECRRCCASNKLVGVPNSFSYKFCSCIAASKAEEYAVEHAIDLVETKKEKEACNGLAAKSDECKFCCQSRLQTAKTTVSSLLAGGCRCAKQYKVKYHSNGTPYISSASGSASSSWSGASMVAAGGFGGFD